MLKRMHIFPFSRLAVQWLKSGLAVLILQLSMLLLHVEHAADKDPYYVLAYYLPTLSYIALSATTVLFFFLALDATVKRGSSC